MGSIYTTIWLIRGHCSEMRRPIRNLSCFENYFFCSPNILFSRRSFGVFSEIYLVPSCISSCRSIPQIGADWRNPLLNNPCRMVRPSVTTHKIGQFAVLTAKHLRIGIKNNKSALVPWRNGLLNYSC